MLWVVSVLSIMLGLGLGALIRGILDSQELLKVQLRAERAERKNDNDIAGAILQSTDAGLKMSELKSPVRPLDGNLQRFGGPPSIHSDDLEIMFLDQLLLRYFHTLMPTWEQWDVPKETRAWDAFVQICPWAKETPLLFEQLTGYKLNDLQLVNAIAEYLRRISKPTTPINPPRAEATVQPEKDYTGV